MGTGSALIALALWLDSLRLAAVLGEDFPQVLSVVTKYALPDVDEHLLIPWPLRFRSLRSLVNLLSGLQEWVCRFRDQFEGVACGKCCVLQPDVLRGTL